MRFVAGATIFCALVINALASSVVAQSVHFSFPLEGYYRAGRFMPIVVSVEDPALRAATITLRAPGALTTAVAMSGRSRAIVPMLMLSAEARQISWSVDSGSETQLDFPLHPLGDNERLIVGTMPQSKAAELFPNRRAMFVAYSNPREMMEALQVAWDLADALVLTDDTVDARELVPLVAGGCVVLNSGNELPPPRVIAGPMSAIEGIDAYAPTFAWHPGASARTRRMAILSGALLAILLIASATLLHKRSAVIAMTLVVIFVGIGLEIWRRNIPPIWSAHGQIVVGSPDGETQIDSWEYLTSRSDAQLSVELIAGTRPVFNDPEQAKMLDGSLFADPSAIRLQFGIKNEMKLAICSRRITRSPSPSPSKSVIASPMLPLAQRLYVNQSTSIIGEGDVEGIYDQTIQWPSIILRRG